MTAERKATNEQNVGKLKPQTCRKAWELPFREQKGSSAPHAQPPMKAARTSKPLDSDGKRLRALNKRLRQIEELQDHEASGTELDEQQRAKCDRLDETIGELSELVVQEV